MEITIQRDGRIAIREHNEDVRFADTTDPLAIFPMFRAHTIFEEGLTLRQLMKALRPWQAVLNKAAWMNFDAWLTAADKTYIADTADENFDEKITSVEIYCVLDLYRSDDGTVHISSHWDFHGKFAQPIDLGSGHLTDTCGLSFTSPREFANVPITIKPNPSVHDIAVGPPDGKRPIISETSPGVYDRLELTPTLFSTVVLGLLDNLSFHGDPEDTAERGEDIAGMVAEIKTREEAKAEANNSNNDAHDQATEEDSDDLTMSFEEFSASLGIHRDHERDEAAFALDKALSEAISPNDELATLLGLTPLGLDEIKRGITAHFDTATLTKMRLMIQAWEQNKRVRELHPDLTDKFQT